jgi:hypothetical protein
MTDGEIRQVQSLSRVNDFGIEREPDFPPTSLGGQRFAAARALVLELDKLGEEQASADGAARASAEAKRVAGQRILRLMRAMRSTAKAMEVDIPGVSDYFNLPASRSDEALINSARAFVTNATPLAANFVQREMPATFLDDLTAAIAEFESAINSLNLNTGKRVGTRAAIKNALARATQLKKELDAIINNKYANDPATLAAWKSARHVERAPKKKEESQPQPSSSK